MNKVTIEITAEGWTTTVEVDGKKLVEKWVSTSTGGARCIEGDFEEDISNEDLFEALSGFTNHDVMRALQQ